MIADRITRPVNVNVHTLLCIGSDVATDGGCSENVSAAIAARLVGSSGPPSWVDDSLRRAPWVVVRRAVHDALIPVGVRGASRAQRFAAWVALVDVLRCVTPQALASERGWRRLPRCTQIPALAELDQVQEIMSAHGLDEAWGPGGSVGFELASGCATANLDSDLDLVLYLDALLPSAVARSLQTALDKLAVRADVLCETPHGAVALTEYARTPDCFMLRTLEGPRLVSHRLV
jgi:phosphoribosyl-dephospho-CoA transferase